MRARLSLKRVFKTVLYMLLMAAVCGWLAIMAYPLFLRLGISEQAASRVPKYALFLGLALGLGIGLSSGMKEIFKAVFAMAALGGAFWFAGVVIEGVLVAAGVREQTVVWVSRVTFGIGLLLGAALVYGVSQDRFEALRSGWQLRRARRKLNLP